MARTREDMLAELKANPRVQALVVGGGINGISTFRELALQGVRVLLVDRGDFCGACSSAPSRMIHGGLRYLENGEIALVRESLRERDALLRNAPHFVRPLPTTVPIQHVLQRPARTAPSACFGCGASRPSAARSRSRSALPSTTSSRATRRTMPRHVFRGREATARAVARPAADGALLGDLPRRLDQPSRTARHRADPRRRSRPRPDALAINHLDATGRDGDRLVLTDTLTGDGVRGTARR